MTNENVLTTKRQVNKLKVYSSAFGIFLLANLAVQTGVTLLENATHQWLYPIFPFTGIGLLIIIVLATNYYIRRRSGKHRPRLWWRIVKPIILILVAYGLTMGAWLSVANADADRAATDYENERPPLPALPEPPKLSIPDGAE